MIERLIWWVYDFIWLLAKSLATAGLCPASMKEYLRIDRTIKHPPQENSVQFLCASAGECNRISLIADKLVSTGRSIEVAFYSTSGIKFARKTGIKHKCLYAPLDRYRDVNIFLENRKPSFVILSSNLLWPNFLRVLVQKGIPYAFVGSSFYPKNWRNQLYLRIISPFLKMADHTFTITQNSYAYLSEIVDHTKITLIKDPRLESILKERKSSGENHIIKNWKKENKLLILGSAYAKEVEMALGQYQLLKSLNYLILIAPHQLNDISVIEKIINRKQINYCKYSSPQEKANTMILDEYGILKSTYQYGEIIWVGGGWNKGVHNVQEAFYPSKRILIGPKFESSPENIELVESEIISVVQNSNDLRHAINTYNPKLESKNTKKIDDYFMMEKSPSETVIEKLSLSRSN